MRSKYLLLLFSVALLLSQSACEEKAEGPRNNPPVANAGQEIVTLVGKEAALDGSSSSDPDGGELTYTWVIKLKPEGSQSVLINSNNSIAIFTPDVAGEYIAELAVSDSKGERSKAEVKITVIPPKVPVDGCRLSVMGYGDGESYEYSTFEYNEAGYVVSSFGDGDDYPTTYVYNSDNLIVQSAYHNTYTTYTYSDGLVIEDKYVDEQGNVYTSTYNYDDQKQLTEIVRDNGNKIKFVYDSRGNVIKEEYYNGKNPNSLSRSTAYEDFDDKTNWVHGVKGFTQLEAFSINKNNPGKEIERQYGNNSSSYTVNYTYQYNEYGYPTKITETRDDGTLETTTFEYEGCK